MNETFIVIMFALQPLAILAGVYMGFKFGKDRPLMEKKPKMIDLEDIAFPEENKEEYPIEEPYISWIKQKDDASAEEK